jgi:hypothetical protein
MRVILPLRPVAAATLRARPSSPGLLAATATKAAAAATAGSAHSILRSKRRRGRAFSVDSGAAAGLRSAGASTFFLLGGRVSIAASSRAAASSAGVKSAAAPATARAARTASCLRSRHSSQSAR